MQPHRVVMRDVPRHYPPRVLQTKRRLSADTIALDGAVEAFDLAVALWIVRRRLDVGHSADADELLEVLGDPLRRVAGYDPRRHSREPLPGALDDLLDVRLGHGLTDLPVDEGAAVAIEQAAQVVERPGEVEVGDVHVPVVVGLEGLCKA